MLGWVVEQEGGCPLFKTGGVFWEQASSSVTSWSYAALGWLPREVVASPKWKILSVALSILIWLWD